MEVGIDIIEIQRIQQALSQFKGFEERILADGELTIFNNYAFSRQLTFLAGRFAAKEAYAKALGCGLGRLRFNQIEILNDPLGRPELIKGPLVREVKLSISHCQSYASAVCLIEADRDHIAKALTQFFNPR